MGNGSRLGLRPSGTTILPYAIALPVGRERLARLSEIGITRKLYGQPIQASAFFSENLGKPMAASPLGAGTAHNYGADITSGPGIPIWSA
jgi:hypothetical protein